MCVIATVQRYVNTASTPGGDGTTNNTAGADRAYASLAEWEANAGGSATDDYIVDCCGTAADTTTVAVDFATSITTGSVTIRSNRSDPAGFYDGNDVISSSHYRLSGTLSTEAYMLWCTESNTVVDGIQVQASRSSPITFAAFRLILVTNSGGFTARNNRCLGLNSGANIGGGIGASVASGASATQTIVNNLVVSCITGIEHRVPQHHSPTINIYHNTVYGNNSGDGIVVERGSSGLGTPTANIKANVSANNSGSDINNAGTVGSSSLVDNATEDATGQFTSIVAADAWTAHGTTASADFRVKNTSSILYNNVNPTLVSDDITEATRDGANHDIGAFEFQATGDESAALGGSAVSVRPFTGSVPVLGKTLSVAL